ncbi:hypothetical protein [Aestuariibaculum sediminum]|uniref:Uncharacterized protein n=1 Tax=Aestuariibaculum sediminum TaxID=2770637 RepID=A0A8J6Q4J3_9FLAO|nr:hypothetical protein [Aestuariibaculum sediminum]MBD0833755.1 hypothetical protein [Aestuariibaculum sediminum]
MKYQQVYQYTYDRTTDAAKRLLIRYFKKSKERHRPFNKINNDFLRWLTPYRETKYEKGLKTFEYEAFSQFNKRYTLYQGEPSKIHQWALEEEVKQAYLGRNYKTYNAFIKDLAINDALNEVSRHYHNYYSYYQLIYEQDKYQYFYLKEFDNKSYESSDEYKEMIVVKYPYKAKEFKASIEDDNNEKESLNEDVNQNVSITESVIADFKDDERMLVLSVLYDLVSKPNHGVQLPEFIRACKIVGLYEDLSVFNDKIQQSTIYQMAYRGIDYTSNKKLQLEKINSVLSKLESLKLKAISGRLRMMKTEVSNKLNK